MSTGHIYCWSCVWVLHCVVSSLGARFKVYGYPLNETNKIVYVYTERKEWGPFFPFSVYVNSFREQIFSFKSSPL